MRKFLKYVAAMAACASLGLLAAPAPVRAQLFSSVQVAVGSYLNPSVTFTADLKSGLYQPAAAQVGVTANQVPGLVVAQSANQDIETAVRGHLVTNRLGDSNPAAPTGQGSSTIIGNDMAGKITIGTGGAGALTLTFAKAYLVAPSCFFIDEVTAGANPGKVLTSLTTAVWTPLATTTTADTVKYLCVGGG